jgi:hypothetical protein
MEGGTVKSRTPNGLIAALVSASADGVAARRNGDALRLSYVAFLYSLSRGGVPTF